MSTTPSTRALPGGSQLGYRHQKVQRLRRLLRRRSLRDAEKVFVIEGPKLINEAIDAGLHIEAIYASTDANDVMLARAHETGVRVHRLAPGVIERIADTVTPQSVMATAAIVERLLVDLADVATVMVLVDVRDPGNAGTMLRSAEAAGIGGVVFCGTSVDPYNPKTVRSAAGSLFHVPIAVVPSIDECSATLADLGFCRIGTAMEGGVAYDMADLSRKVAFVFGNEANGLPENILGGLDELVSIPIVGRTESLNVSMAASVLCFEAARQRRFRGEQVGGADERLKDVPG